MSVMDLTGPDFSNASYWIEIDESGERLVMPIRRNWKRALAALGVFAVGAVQHLYDIPDPIDLFYKLVAAFWLFGFIHLLLNILTSLFARETLRVECGELVHGWRLLGLTREKRYPMRDIQALSASREINPPKDDQLFSPLVDFGKTGVVNFDFKGRTIGVGAALDQAHGQQVVNWLARRGSRSMLDL